MTKADNIFRLLFFYNDANLPDRCLNFKVIKLFNAVLLFRYQRRLINNKP